VCIKKAVDQKYKSYFKKMTTEILIGLAGLLIAIAAFIKSHKPQEIVFPVPREEMHGLKMQFIINQKLSIEIQDLLKSYIESSQCSDELFYQNLTFSKYLDFLKNKHVESLSETVYEKTLSERIYTRPVIENMSKSLENQYNNLMLVKNQIKILSS
jgi:CRISPR/Cas system CMR-associated protein Cmr5 small subunit